MSFAEWMERRVRLRQKPLPFFGIDDVEWLTHKTEFGRGDVVYNPAQDWMGIVLLGPVREILSNDLKMEAIRIDGNLYERVVATIHKPLLDDGKAIVGHPSKDDIVLDILMRRYTK